MKLTGEFFIILNWLGNRIGKLVIILHDVGSESAMLMEEVAKTKTEVVEFLIQSIVVKQDSTNWPGQLRNV